MFGPRIRSPRISPHDRSYQTDNYQHPYSNIDGAPFANYPQRRGSFLSRLLQRKKGPTNIPNYHGNMNPLPPYSSSPSPSIQTKQNSALAGGGLATILAFLENAQKSIEVAQTVVPMVQQYGPLLKSLPEIIAMFNEQSSNEKEEKNNESEVMVNDEELETNNFTNKTVENDNILDQLANNHIDDISEEKKDMQTHNDKNINNVTKKQIKTKRKKNNQNDIVGKTPPPKLFF